MEQLSGCPLSPGRGREIRSGGREGADSGLKDLDPSRGTARSCMYIAGFLGATALPHLH